MNAATKEKSWSLKDFVIYCPTEAGLDKVIAEARLSGIDDRRRSATYPIFDACLSSRMRALAAIGIGCDQHPGGAPGVGPAKMLKQIEAIAAADNGSAEGKAGRLEKAIADWLDAESGSAPGIHATLADSLMFEPANEAGAERSYVFGAAPTSLEGYLSEMAADGTTIVNNLETATCPGPCHGNPHKFLIGEGKEQYCGPCYASSAVVPGGCGGVNTDISITSMKAALTQKGVEGVAGIDDPDVIEDLYAEHVESDKPESIWQ